MEQSKFKFGLSGSTLKIIAIVTMLIDHTGATVIRAIQRHPYITESYTRTEFWKQIYSQSRDIGRIAFPIFCFFIVEGFLHTKNAFKYAFRLFLFALLSEIPFDIALKGNWFYPNSQNVYFTLLFGLIALIGIAQFTDHMTKRIYLAVIPIACMMKLADILKTDYSYKGVFLIAAMYLMHTDRLNQCAVGAVSVAWELPAPLAFIPVYFYNGQRGRQMKFFFYLFYPLHLLLLWPIKIWIIPYLMD